MSAAAEWDDDDAPEAGDAPEAHMRAFLRFRGDSYPVELQALDCPDGRYTVNRFAHARDEGEAVRLAAEADAWGAPGVYVVMNAVAPAVATRSAPGRWHVARKGESTTDADITARLLLFVDVDARRPRGTSSTDEELGAARAVASQISERLIASLGPGAVAMGATGNGAALFVALECPDTDLPEVKDILSALDKSYSTDRVHVDPSVSDAKRLCPAFGTVKRKGAAGVAERPHRVTSFQAPEWVTRVGLEALRRLRDELSPPAPAAAPRPAVGAPGPAPADDPFARANAVPVAEVLAWLGLLEGEQPTCPGCREEDGTAVAVVGNGVRCMHARCAAKGHPGKPGFYSVVDIVAMARGCKPIEAVREIGKRFGFEVELGRKRDRAAPAAADDGRPIIRVGVDLHRVVDEAAEALGAEPNAYQRDGQLVRVVRVAADEETAKDEAGTPFIRELPLPTLREALSKRAQWLRYDGRTEDYVPCLPPEAVLAALAARGSWRSVRPIVGILEAPSVRPDGSVITTAGYDAATGCLYDPSPELAGLRVPDRPTQDEANEALVELCEVWLDFPFASEPPRMVPVAALLTLLARPAIRGSCPGFVVDAPTRGTGKTLVNDAAAMIATGRLAAKMSWPADEAELEKVLASYALRGAALVNFDNVSTRFGGGPLDKVLTCGDFVELRILGRSEVPTLRWRAIVLASGNNLELGGDTARRVLWCRMESPLERPEERTGFRHPNLLSWVGANRPRLVRAALVVLRAYVAAGRPDMQLGQWGSFEAWAALVPPAIAFAGGANVLEARAVAAGHEEPERVALEAILTHWPRLGGDKGMTARDAIARLYSPERLRGQGTPDGFDGLRDAIETLVQTQPGRAPSARALGYALRRLRGRVVGMALLDHGNARDGVAVWLVKDVRSGSTRCG
ncbi:MAG: hypothetical protein HY908_02100 [Myxococcales bacterium]|nr:hypothetical protein [Myxococcales bacterium]